MSMDLLYLGCSCTIVRTCARTCTILQTVLHFASVLNDCILLMLLKTRRERYDALAVVHPNASAWLHQGLAASS